MTDFPTPGVLVPNASFVPSGENVGQPFQDLPAPLPATRIGWPPWRTRKISLPQFRRAIVAGLAPLGAVEYAIHSPLRTPGSSRPWAWRGRRLRSPPRGRAPLLSRSRGARRRQGAVATSRISSVVGRCAMHRASTPLRADEAFEPPLQTSVRNPTTAPRPCPTRRA